MLCVWTTICTSSQQIVLFPLCVLMLIRALPDGVKSIGASILMWELRKTQSIPEYAMFLQPHFNFFAVPDVLVCNDLGLLLLWKMPLFKAKLIFVTLHHTWTFVQGFWYLCSTEEENQKDAGNTTINPSMWWPPLHNLRHPLLSTTSTHYCCAVQQKLFIKHSKAQTF